jgi:DNA-binding GntR family transcriptional regulator
MAERMQEMSSKRNLSEKAYRYIKSKVMAGDMVANGVLSEESIAKEMGISKTPVREAIRQLSIEGVLEQIPRYGTVVRELTLKDIVEIGELREALEPYAVAKGVKNLTGEGVFLLKGLCEEIKELMGRLVKSKKEFLDERDTRRFLAVDLGFHMTMIRASQNKRIMDILINARSLARLFGAMHKIDLSKLEKTYERHIKILKAVVRKEPELAAEAMLEHIKASKKLADKEYRLLSGLKYTNSESGKKKAVPISLKQMVEECGMYDLVGEVV